MHTLTQSYGFLLGKVLQQMENRFADKLTPFQIDARQYGILLFIKENPDSSQKVVADKMHIDRTTMVSHVDDLEKMAYVQRVKNPADRRAYSLNLTDRGNDVLESCWEFLVKTEADVLSPLHEQERQAFKESLIKLWSSF